MKVAYSRSSDDPQMQRFHSLRKRFNDIGEVACETQSAAQSVYDQLNTIATTLGLPNEPNPFRCGDDDASACDKDHSLPDHVMSSAHHNNIVRSPIHVKRKGRPRTNRLKSTVKKITKRKKTATARNKASRNLMVCMLQYCVFLY